MHPTLGAAAAASGWPKEISSADASFAPSCGGPRSSLVRRGEVPTGIFSVPLAPYSSDAPIR
jgi:hypothetical protein